jgi:AraC-like DNA-binding protein
LLEACLILSNPKEKKRISKIAEDLCFADASSFARAFRKDFGYSPGEVRAAAVAKLATDHDCEPAAAAGAAQLRP